MFFFFFKQKTAYEIKECDWSSDVCSSDLVSGNGNKFSRIELEIFCSIGSQAAVAMENAGL